jgi:hypothetical protein
VVHRFLSAVNVRPTISIVFHFLLVVQELKQIVPATVPSVLLPNMRAFPDVKGKFHAKPAPPPVFAMPPAPGAGEPACGACLILLLAISDDQPKFHPVLLLLTSLILLHLLLSC